MVWHDNKSIGLTLFTKKEGEFWSIAVVDAPEQSEFDAVGVGVNPRMENLSTGSGGEIFGN